MGRYLVGEPPGDYVCNAYERAVVAHGERFAPSGRLDRALLGLSRTPLVPLRAVDITARFVAPSSSIRRRLVLLTALLESAPETFERYEAPDAGGAGFLLRLTGRLIVSGLSLAIGLLALAVALPFRGASS